MLSDAGLTITWFVAASTLVVLVFLVVGFRRNRVDERLQGLESSAGGKQRLGPTSARYLRGGLPPLIKVTENPVDQWATQRMKKEERKRGLKQRLEQAGLYKPRAVHLFLAFRMILLAGSVGLGFLAGKMGFVPMTQGLVLGALVGAMGTLAPSFWLDHLKRSRQTQIRRALPDALDVLVVCLEGGLSLTGALSRVARELVTAHPMLALEFHIVERQTQMGRTTGEAVRELANRFDLEELRSMASVVIQAEKMGSSVVSALQVFADTLREKRFQRAEELAQKAVVKILFPTFLFIFPGIFVVILGPAAMQVYQVLINGVMRQSF